LQWRVECLPVNTLFTNNPKLRLRYKKYQEVKPEGLPMAGIVDDFSGESKPDYGAVYVKYLNSLPQDAQDEEAFIIRFALETWMYSREDPQTFPPIVVVKHQDGQYELLAGYKRTIASRVRIRPNATIPAHVADIRSSAAAVDIKMPPVIRRRLAMRRCLEGYKGHKRVRVMLIDEFNSMADPVESAMRSYEIQQSLPAARRNRQIPLYTTKNLLWA